MEETPMKCRLRPLLAGLSDRCACLLYAVGVLGGTGWVLLTQVRLCFFV
jgi:hypothetical protein